MDPPEQLVFLVCLHSLAIIVKSQACGPGLTLTFAKIPNMLPRTAYPPVLLYAQAPGVAITATCYNKCKETPNCDGFIVDYKHGTCYRVNVGRQVEDYQMQPTVHFFRKVCLRVPRECIQRAWPVEYIPGYKLLAEQSQVVPNIADKWMCAQLCFNGIGREGVRMPCRSAQYQAWSRTCTLSQYDRHTSPESFTPSVSSNRDFDYMENQCPVFNGYTPDGQPAADEYCWHDPIYNKTSLRSDKELDNLTEKQCEWRCQTEASFRCVAYTFQCPVYGNRISRCSLHSDEVTPRATPLVPHPCTTYRERINCLDLSIQCSPASIVVTLREKMFGGQIFVRGHAFDCVASNNGQDHVTLVIPLPQTEFIRNKCDVQIVKGIGEQDRSVATTTIVVQHHRLIQTATDRVVRVSCYLDTNNVVIGPGESSRPQPGTNVTLSSSFYVKDPIPVQNVIEGYGSYNNATYPPSAEMRVVDVARGGRPASETELGDELELQIFVNPSYNVSMLRAGHLIASSGSGQDSLLLLDWRGCPPDPTTFPPLTPVNNSVLIARFRAFKFPDSNIIRFSVILTFCVTKCQPTDCGNGLTSFGKRRRRSLSDLPGDDEATLMSSHGRRWRRSVDDIMEEIPLQLELIVMTPGAKSEGAPNPHVSANDTDSTGTSRSSTAELVCASLGTTFMISAAWIVLQILLLIGCCWVISRRDKRPSDRQRLENDFQPKHVSWGDPLNSSSLDVGRPQDRNQPLSVRS